MAHIEVKNLKFYKPKNTVNPSPSTNSTMKALCILRPLLQNPFLLTTLAQIEKMGEPENQEQYPKTQTIGANRSPSSRLDSVESDEVAP